MESLPVDEALPRLKDVLRAGSAAVLVAPPGVKITSRNISRERRYPIVNGFRG